METKFPSHSPVGRLYQEMVQQAQARGLSPQKLQQGMDTGYTEDPVYLPAAFNDPGKISAGEVLEVAYRFSEYYPLLVKHGFPVPFALDDFDPRTEEDFRLRQQIEGVIHQVRIELAKENCAVGSDRYRLALAKRLYDWLLPQFKKFRADPKHQRTAWEAYRLQKGECTEKSAIAFAVFQAAGLKPCFFFVQSVPPTLRNYFGASEDSYKAGHVFIGFPLAEAKRWVHVDLSSELWDADYPDAVVTTPRQYTTSGHLHNQWNSIPAGPQAAETRERLSRQCRQIAPQSFFCLELGVEIFSNRAGLEAGRTYLQENAEQLRHYPGGRLEMEQALKSVEAIRRGQIKNYLAVTEERLTELETLAQTSPRFAANHLTQIYHQTAQILEQILKAQPAARGSWLHTRLVEQARTALMQAIAIYPSWMYPYWELRELVQREPALFPEVFAFLHQIAQDNPRHAIAHYLAAEIGFQTIRDATFALSEAEVEKIRQHYTRLEELEPDHPATLMIGFHDRLYRRELEEAVALLEAGRAKLQGQRLPLNLYGSGAVLYVMLGQTEKALTLLRELYDFAPPDGPFALMLLVQAHLWPRLELLDEVEKKEETRGFLGLGEEEGSRVTEFLFTLLQWLSDHHATRERVEVLWGRLLFWARMLRQRKMQHKIEAKLTQPPSPVVKEALQKEFDDFTTQLKTVRRLRAKKIKEAETLFSGLKPWLGADASLPMAKAYVELARLAFCQNEWNLGRRFFAKAAAFSPEIFRPEIYGSRLVQEFFTPWLEKREDPILRRRCWEALELGFSFRGQFSPALMEVVKTGYRLLAESQVSSAARRLENLD